MQNKGNKKNIYNRIILILALAIPFTIFTGIFIITSNNSVNWNSYQGTDKMTNIYLVSVKNDEEFEIIKEISIGKKDSLVYDLSHIDYRNDSKNGIPTGVGFLIKYYDDSYEIITQSYPCVCKYENLVMKTNYSKYYSLDDEFYRLIVDYYN